MRRTLVIGAIVSVITACVWAELAQAGHHRRCRGGCGGGCAANNCGGCQTTTGDEGYAPAQNPGDVAPPAPPAPVPDQGVPQTPTPAPRAPQPSAAVTSPSGLTATTASTTVYPSWRPALRRGWRR
jgi:hypothetical protein